MLSITEILDFMIDFMMFIISLNKTVFHAAQALFERVMEHRKSPWNSFSYDSDSIIMINDMDI